MATWLACPQCQLHFQVSDVAAKPRHVCPGCAAAIPFTTDETIGDRWYYAQQKQKIGPVSFAQLQALVKTGRLHSTDMILGVHSPKWVTVSTVITDQTIDDTRSYIDSSESMPVVPGYEIERELGRGGMGVVYQALQTKLKRTVGLKMLLAGEHAGMQEQSRFRAEAEALARLQHPNIVQVYEVGNQDGRPFFSMEYVAGGSLDKKLNGAPLPPREAAQMVEVLARAIQAAHENHIIHRDLKPANVLLTETGQPKITDFGLAKQLDTPQDQTRSGAIMGTPSYLAPEQAAGQSRTIGPPADIYALGTILYELLTGRPPFRGATSLDTILLVLSDEPVPPSRLQPKVPRDLETICLKCLQKDPRKRFGSAQDLANDLQHFQKGEPIQARPPSPPQRLWLWCRRNPVAASIILAVTLGSAVGFWHLSSLSKQLVQSTALESASQQSEMLEGVNTFYSSIVDRVKPHGIEVTHDYGDKDGAIPLPATLTIDLSKHISDQSRTGMRVRLYSQYPFRFRKNGGPHDGFERYALARLQEDPTKPVYRFEEYQGRAVLRYATGRVMKESCIACHNTHPESVKTDWKVGDVRGVLEITRPLDNDIARTRQGLQGTFLLVGVIAAVLLAGSSFLFVYTNRKRGSAEVRESA